MPFGGNFDHVFSDLILPALPAYDTIRADTELDHRGILEKIVTGIARASLVIADLTTRRPNVMYELGIAHTLGKPTVMLAQDLTDLPFDISAYPVLAYSTEPGHDSDLLSRLREIGERHLRRGIPFGSPVIDYLEGKKRREIEPLLRPDYSSGDFSADMAEHTPRVLDYLLRFRTSIEELSPVIDALTRQVAQTTETRTPETIARWSHSADQTSNELRYFGEVIESDIVPGFHRSWTHLGQAMLWYSTPARLQAMSSTDFEAGKDAVAYIDAAVATAIEYIGNLRNAMPGVRGLTRELTASARSAEHALDLFLSEMAFAREYLYQLKQRLGMSG